MLNGRIRSVVVLDIERLPVRGRTDLDGVSIADRAFEELLREREEHLRTHDTRNRACTVRVGVALLDEPLFCGVVDVHRYPAPSEARLNVSEAEVDDLEDGRFGELVEDEHRVETIEQLRREVFRGALEDLVARLSSDYAVLVRSRLVREDVAAEVAREADDRVLEVDLAACNTPTRTG